MKRVMYVFGVTLGALYFISLQVISCTLIKFPGLPYYLMAVHKFDHCDYQMKLLELDASYLNTQFVQFDDFSIMIPENCELTNSDAASSSTLCYQDVASGYSVIINKNHSSELDYQMISSVLSLTSHDFNISNFAQCEYYYNMLDHKEYMMEYYSEIYYFSNERVSGFLYEKIDGMFMDIDFYNVNDSTTKYSFTFCKPDDMALVYSTIDSIYFIEHKYNN